MQYLTEIGAALSEKRLLLLTLEGVMNSLAYESEITQVIELASQRAELIEQLRQSDAQIGALCADYDDVRAILNYQVSPATLEGAHKWLYEQALAVRAVLARIADLENIVRTQLLQHQHRLKTNIESLNLSSASVAGRYHSAMVKPSPIGRKKDRIV